MRIEDTTFSEFGREQNSKHGLMLTVGSLWSQHNHNGRRAFSIAGPTVWNSLPDELGDPACGSDSFKQFLKTILFSLY